ncbi:MAG: hypothetical protein H0X25_06110 [Acidobacteriales bacterium]|nr:hypothetical protein [Terriglobales bacterium]
MIVNRQWTGHSVLLLTTIVSCLVAGLMLPAIAQTPAPYVVHPAKELYFQLSNASLDPHRVYQIRDASISRAGVHFTFSDGTIAFTSDVSGRITGAFFEGDAEVLLMPPSTSERASMALFTGGAILEERIVSAYFRFNDELFRELQPFLRHSEEGDDFVGQWGESARTLAQADALRLFLTLSQLLPEDSGASAGGGKNASQAQNDRFLHARLQGRRLGSFDIYFDTEASEQIWAGQAKTSPAGTFYDVWTSFETTQRSRDQEAMSGMTAEEGKSDGIQISSYTINAEVTPPRSLVADASLQIEVHTGGPRAVLFELSRYLLLRQVEFNGEPLEFIQNPAVEGTQLSRRGNDLVAVVFPRALKPGEKLQLRFEYGGEVLSEAGPGLLYVGARGTWYPNRGMAMSNFDLQFRYPQDWTLVATGKAKAGPLQEGAFKVSHFVSERPFPLAGFNLGRYSDVNARAGDVEVSVYATDVMERGLMQQSPDGKSKTALSPARNAQAVADRAAQAIIYYSRHFGDYPFAGLALTQMPGPVSQGWPSLVFLSSLAFMNPEEGIRAHMDPVNAALTRGIIAHETAHQWWGDLVLWNSYRDQWLVEALANYSALMLLESEDSATFHAILSRYRDDLLLKNADGVPLNEAGAVGLGSRLSSSHFPGGYDAISYGRGTWLMHMLRSMMRDAEEHGRDPIEGQSGRSNAEEPFVRALRKLRERYQGQPVSTRQFLDVIASEMPARFRYSSDKSLNWFMQGWVYGTALPSFDLHNVKYADRAGSTSVVGTLRQKDAPIDLITPVPLYANTSAGRVYLGRVFADGPDTPFHFSAPPGTRNVMVDPYETILSRGK